LSPKYNEIYHSSTDGVKGEGPTVLSMFNF